MADNFRLVIWHIDDTDWRETSMGEGVRKFLQANRLPVMELARRGIVSTICFRSDLVGILPLLKDEGFLEYVAFPNVYWESKDERLGALIEAFQLSASHVVFLDCNSHDQARAIETIPGLQTESGAFVSQMLNDPRFQGCDDHERITLRHYKAQEQRKYQDANEFIRAAYKSLLRRDPEPGIVEIFAPTLAWGGLSYARYLSSITSSREFLERWISAEPKPRRSESEHMDPIRMWAPEELSLESTCPKRVLIVGSCLSEEIRAQLSHLKVPCESDLYFVGTDLPAFPEHPLVEYDFQIVQLALRHILPDSAFARLQDPDVNAHQLLFDHACAGMEGHFDKAMRWNREHGILTFVFTFIEPMQNPFGRLQSFFDLRNPIYFIRQLNQALSEQVAANPNCHLVDLNGALSFHGRRLVQDDLITGFNHGSFLTNFDDEYDQGRLETAGAALELFETKAVDAFHLIWRDLIARYRTVRQIDQVKLLVVDLDDTIWRGVVAELDLNCLPPFNGWPVGLWEALLVLKRRGILLGIISKNNEAQVVQAWPAVFGGRLQIDDFAIRKINWDPKPENMAAILAQLNLLPGNVLYLDDNPVERAAIKAAFPEIRTLGGSPLHWRRILLWSPETQVATITKESSVRTDMVKAQVLREKNRQVMPREEFLSSLKVSMKPFEIANADHPSFPRALELINKTNQFNTTGKRWKREECVAVFAEGTKFYAFEISDKYTAYGLVVVAVVKDALIHQFVMSCRVMGLEVEFAAISYLGKIASGNGAKTMFAAMTDTERNLPCRNFYQNCGFKIAAGGWERALSDWLPAPKHVNLKPDISSTEKTLESIS